MLLAVLCSLPYILTMVFAEEPNDTEFQYYMNLIESEILKSQTRRGLYNASMYKPKSAHVSEFGKFDYIIVGGGTAGAVIANRLSEVPENKVLLLEAGGYENDFTDIPAFYSYLMNSEFSWNFFTVPQKRACLGMVNQQCACLRGRGLGGCSITNTLNYLRGNKRDYDNWANEGNPGWSYNDVLPLFKKMEHVTFPHDPKYRGEHGEIRVEYERRNAPVYYSFLEANIERGRKVVDYNAGQQLGVNAAQQNTIHGRRQTTNKAFLKPIRNRPNLFISVYSYAIKININKRKRRAYGVTFSKNQTLYIARANKEVILSAGAIQSPQILMLSGIGLRKHLKSHKIPALKHLSVGSNLQNHQGYIGLLLSTNLTSPNTSLDQQIREYLQGYGDLTFTFHSLTNVFAQTKLETTPDYPDIQLISGLVSNSGDQAFNNYNNETFESIFSRVNFVNTFTVDLCLMHPKSRGSIKLKSADPYAFPLIDFNFYLDKGNFDKKTMYEGIKVILDLLETKAFRSVNATLLDTTHPGCKHHKYLSKKYWFCQLEYLTIPFYHPAGSCKMGPDSGRGAVVNHELKVHGIKNLRVADASIMPTVVSGNSFVASVMIGEKAAQLILNQ